MNTKLQYPEEVDHSLRKKNCKNTHGQHFSAAAGREKPGKTETQDTKESSDPTDDRLERVRDYERV